MMSQSKVIFLDIAENIDEAAIGGKAMNLVRMKRFGFLYINPSITLNQFAFPVSR
jgi:hypothetical protein